MTDRPTEVDWAERLARDIKSGVRTALPGDVVKYTPATSRAAVQPARRGKVSGQSFDLPQIPAAPVLWPRFGGVVLVGNLLPGDPVLIVVSDRELDSWLLTGGPYDPKSGRRHEFTDAMVLPAPPSPVNRPIKVGGSGAQTYFGREDGQASIAFTNAPAPGSTTIEGQSGIRLGTAAAEGALRGTALVAGCNVANPLSAAGILNAVPAAGDLVTTAALANANKAAILAICALIVSALSTKVFIE